jgi:beta-lactamase superfamily II metal-dependent hydrolase
MNLIGSSSDNPPYEDEVEVSVFGPGYGESVLVHLGQNEWMIVDSCLDSSSGRPAVIEYLRKLGVSPAEAVKLIVATHWHDDHIRGLGTIFRACESARFVCSGALRFQEFGTLVKASETRSMMTSSGVREFDEIMSMLQERRAKSAQKESVGPGWAAADQLLWRRLSPDGVSCEVYALSPSDAAKTLAYHEIARLLPQAGALKRRVVAQPPNLVAVVLWVRIGDVMLLLGSDLEETTNPGTGWSVIVDSSRRPIGQASVLKVPHHGSVTADQPRVWTEMLEPEPIAVLTPFHQGNVTLPTQIDVSRIHSRTTKAYATSVTAGRKSKHRSGVVEKTIRETVRGIRDAQGPTGQVRLRRSVVNPNNSEWKVELLGAAVPLQNLL